MLSPIYLWLNYRNMNLRHFIWSSFFQVLILKLWEAQTPVSKELCLQQDLARVFTSAVLCLTKSSTTGTWAGLTSREELFGAPEQPLSKAAAAELDSSVTDPPCSTVDQNPTAKPKALNKNSSIWIKFNTLLWWKYIYDLMNYFGLKYLRGRKHSPQNNLDALRLLGKISYSFILDLYLAAERYLISHY